MLIALLSLVLVAANPAASAAPIRMPASIRIATGMSDNPKSPDYAFGARKVFNPSSDPFIIENFNVRITRTMQPNESPAAVAPRFVTFIGALTNGMNTFVQLPVQLIRVMHPSGGALPYAIWGGQLSTFLPIAGGGSLEVDAERDGFDYSGKISKEAMSVTVDVMGMQ